MQAQLLRSKHHSTFLLKAQCDLQIWCVCSVGKAGKDSGMVLPFDPMTMTFKDLHYFVPIAKVSSCRKIEFAALSGIDC